MISNQEDAASLQEDLDHLQEWERDWQMNINPDKYEKIRITIKRKIIQTTYEIHGQVLKETTKAKYLGVTIDKTLSWNSHIDMVTKRANQTISFLQRDLSSCPKDVKEASYKTVVRPQLQSGTHLQRYAATRSKLSRDAQQDSARMTIAAKNLGWGDLQHRREKCKTIMMY